MTTIARIASITKNGWTELSSGVSYVTIEPDPTMVAKPDILIRIGTADPGAGVTEGIRRNVQELPLQISGLLANERVYARSVDETTALVVQRFDLPNMRLAAGEEHLGEVGGVTLVAKASPTVDTSGYIANDALFSKQAMTVARIAAGSGRLTRIAVRSRTVVTVQMFLHIFDSDPTASTLTRSSPVSIHANDQARILKTLSIPPSQWNSLRGQSPWLTAELLGISAEMTNLGFKLASGTDMFFVVETAGVHAPGTTTDINLIVESESN